MTAGGGGGGRQHQAEGPTRVKAQKATIGSPGAPVWLSLPPTLPPGPSFHRTPCCSPCWGSMDSSEGAGVGEGGAYALSAGHRRPHAFPAQSCPDPCLSHRVTFSARERPCEGGERSEGLATT